MNFLSLKKAGKIRFIAMSTVIALVAVICMNFLVVAEGQTPSYKGFTYDTWEEAVPSQIGYDAYFSLSGKELGEEVGDFKEPKDMVSRDDGSLFILDSGNNRVVILDAQLKLNKIVNKFFFEENEIVLNNPTGLYVDKNDAIYIADPGNEQIVVSDFEGKVLHVIKKPETELLENGQEFRPQKILVDDSGLIYVVATGVYQGSLIFDSDWNFQGFYGSNSVKITPKLLWDYLWKRIMTDEAAVNLSRYVSEEIGNLTIDSEGFIYIVTPSGTATEKIRKLNAKGQNILLESEFGELEQLYINGVLASSRFVDVVVDSRGYISGLDQNNCRIFQYDNEGELLFIFGGNGIQRGTFLSPCAIANLGNKIVVLDQQKNNITFFRPTEFGEKVHNAVEFYNDGLYSDAAQLWDNVIKYDHNYNLAYISIGKALMAENRFDEAADYFRIGNDRKGNSDAFAARRNNIIQKFFPLICFAIIALVVLVFVKIRKKEKVVERGSRGKILARHFLFHPTESSEEMKTNNGGSLRLSFIILIFWFVAVVFQFSLTGFRFNFNNPDSINIGMLFLRTFLLFAVWVFANWGVTTLMDGKGKIKEIWITNAYSLIPYILSIYINIILSWVLVADESMFMGLVTTIGFAWSVVLILGTLSGIHEYSISRTVWSVILTICGILLILFLVLLVIGMVQQAYGFVYSIINELLYRFR